MFERLINEATENLKSQIIPIDKYNLDALIQLISNSKNTNEPVSYASFDQSLWLNDFLVKYIDNIKYCSKFPSFDTFSIENEIIKSKHIRTETISFDSDEELDNFFTEREGRILVLYTVNKFIDLKTLDVFYKIRYGDITEKDDERQIKIDKILK